MANTLLYNLAAMTVASTGTGTITLGAAARIGGVLFLTFALAGVANGDIVAYSILDPAGASEVGFGTYSSAGPTLTRNPTTSTNANAAINMSAQAIVRISPRLQDIGTPGARPGTNTNTTVASGNVGEILTATRTRASAASLSTGVSINATSLSFTAGNWLVYGSVGFTGTAASISCIGGFSTTTATLPGFDSNQEVILPSINISSLDALIGLPPQPMSFSTGTSVFLIGQGIFGAGVASLYGTIAGIRIA